MRENFRSKREEEQMHKFKLPVTAEITLNELYEQYQLICMTESTDEQTKEAMRQQIYGMFCLKKIVRLKLEAFDVFLGATNEEQLLASEKTLNHAVVDVYTWSIAAVKINKEIENPTFKGLYDSAYLTEQFVALEWKLVEHFLYLKLKGTSDLINELTVIMQFRSFNSQFLAQIQKLNNFIGEEYANILT